MNKNPLFSITALFASSDDLLHAVEEVVKKDYTLFDCNTPFPVHGLDQAMKIPNSKLGYFALVFGFIGTLTAILSISWITLSDYPLVIGGKPFWSWPAFVPVSFELTVLLASVLSTIAMIVLYFKFPNNAHPLHDTPYMKAVSSDKFGISIQADDPKFNEKEVTRLLKSVGGKDIAPVYFDIEDLDHGQKIFDPKFVGVLAVTALVVSATAYGILNHALYWEPFNWMMNQNKLKAQKTSGLFKNGIGMQYPVEGTVARGFLPYPFKGQPDSAGKYFLNPILPAKEVIGRGRVKFLTFCSPCHGNFGFGDSRLLGQFPNPPTLHSDKVRNWPDGNIYHVMTEGQNVMPGYAAQISREDRWAIVHYIRVLQQAHNAKESDLK